MKLNYSGAAFEGTQEYILKKYKVKEAKRWRKADLRLH